MHGWKSIGLFAILILASCAQTPTLVPQPNQAKPLFTDEDLDGANLISLKPRALQGRDDGSTGSDDRSPVVDLPEHPQSAFETQAVIPGSRGFIYYIRKETSSTATLFCSLTPAIATWRVIRQNLSTGSEIQFLCSTREVQSVAGSSDGTQVFISRKDTTANGNDFEIFSMVLGSGINQFTNNTTPDTNISISDAGAMVWQGKHPTTSIDAVFIFNGGITFLDFADPQQQPSLSANGQFITLVRRLADGRDRIMRFNTQTSTYSTLFTTTADLEHPSITDDGTKMAFLQNGGITDTILLKTVGVSTLTTVASNKFTLLEHPHITRDGRWITYAAESNDVFNIFTKHLATGIKAQLTSVTGNVDSSNAYWQLPAPFTNEIKRTEANGGIFGGDVALEGNTLVVGSRVATVGINTGAVFIYERNGAGPESWSLVQTLTSPTNTQLGDFGNAVAINGNTMIVGEFTRDVDNLQSRGAAYIFQRNATGQWEFVKELITNDLEAQDNFGFDVDIFADTAVVSALRGDTTKSDSGSIYIFERNQGGSNQWGLVQKRFASDAATDDIFSNSVAIYENTIVVGSPGDDNTRGLEAGSVYFFERNTGGTNNWGQVRKRVALNGASGEAVGFSVAIDKNQVAAGAPGALSGSGAIYLFKQGNNNTWAEINRIFPQIRPADADLGYSVDLNDRYLVAGAWRDNQLGNDAGSAYIFNLQQNKSELKLLASDGNSNDHFGFSVAVSGDTVVIGAERALDNQGQVYLYE